MLHSLLLTALLSGAAFAQVAPAPASNIPFGADIRKCTKPGSYALTYDDGPFTFTPTLLANLKAKGHRATFFVNAENFGNILDMGPVLKQMLQDGHQIASHGFNHIDFAKTSEELIRSNMTKLDDELQQLIGMTPTYMRPPFFSTNELSLRVLGEMQYHVINADIDTKDFEFTTPETNDKAFDNFVREFQAGGTLSLMHDVHNTTVNQLMPKVFDVLEKAGKKSIPVGECLGDAPQNWYRNGSPSAGPRLPPNGGNQGENGKGGNKGQKGNQGNKGNNGKGGNKGNGGNNEDRNGNGRGGKGKNGNGEHPGNNGAYPGNNGDERGQRGRGGENQGGRGGRQGENQDGRGGRQGENQGNRGGRQGENQGGRGGREGENQGNRGNREGPNNNGPGGRVGGNRGEAPNEQGRERPKLLTDLWNLVMPLLQNMKVFQATVVRVASDGKQSD
ncbi:hypothetical protein HIM_02937 [Hirsutella minnesotensis 3608]|nr:hypothetical protein HIM_02937 [Hirsutella minnesotensis 3608]